MVKYKRSIKVTTNQVVYIQILIFKRLTSNMDKVFTPPKKTVNVKVYIDGC